MAEGIPEGQGSSTAGSSTESGPDQRQREEIGKLKSWLDSMPHLVCRSDEAFLLRFLRVAKFDQDRAQMLLDNYITIRKSPRGSPQWFQYPPLDSERMQFYMSRPFLHLHLGSKANGEAVYLSVLRYWQPERMPLDQLIVAMYMTADVALIDERSQTHGVTVIVDLSQVGMRQLSLLQNRRILASLLRNWQDAFPVRVKSVVYINEPKYFSVLLALIKSLPLKQKLKERLHTAGEDGEKLRRLLSDVPGEADALLPAELGGRNRTIEELMEDAKRQLHSAEVQEEWRLMGEMNVVEQQRPQSAKAHSCAVM